MAIVHWKLLRPYYCSTYYKAAGGACQASALPESRFPKRRNPIGLPCWELCLRQLRCGQGLCCYITSRDVTCQNCTAGSYVVLEGSEEFVQCPEFNTLSEDSSNVTQCTCNEGNYKNGVVCNSTISSPVVLSGVPCLLLSVAGKPELHCLSAGLQHAPLLQCQQHDGLHLHAGL